MVAGAQFAIIPPAAPVLNYVLFFCSIVLYEPHLRNLKVSNGIENDLQSNKEQVQVE